MQTTLFLLNSLGKVDRRFFLICGIIIAGIVAVYLLIPVLRREQYVTQRAKLRERERAFNANKKARDAESEDIQVDLSTSQNDGADDK